MTRQAHNLRSLVDGWTAEAGERLRVAVRARGKQADVAALVPISRQRFVGMMSGEIVPSEVAFERICEVVGVTPDYLLKGEDGPPRPKVVVANASPAVAVEDAEWSNVPEYNVTEMTDDARGPHVSMTPFRRDWLNRVLGRSRGVWLTTLPAGYPALDLAEGDLVFVKDAKIGVLVERAPYLWRMAGTLFVARFSAFGPNSSDRPDERFMDSSKIGQLDGGAFPVARLLGVAMKRLG